MPERTRPTETENVITTPQKSETTESNQNRWTLTKKSINLLE